MDDRENKFNYMVEQIRNFITHCLGFQPEDMTGVNKTTLNVTTNIEQSPYFKRYYIIQAFIDCLWQDVLFSRGDIFTAEKKARHYRNQNDCETRVIAIKEDVTYSYDYSLVTEYSKKEGSL